ncbi:MAG: hypothetical protein Sylvanvirus4_31 [Sylvanvirus sp.]|uniref:Uncharacterized protein n=1 Tax=Sylvanvirus sp. TaxID=2487774 RepID=A0A3G5AHE5_9VIRU|nr:MAG: hypothetical protein Sylvanvirus4_31 [Sylvanvirus sp.]
MTTLSPIPVEVISETMNRLTLLDNTTLHNSNGSLFQTFVTAAENFKQPIRNVSNYGETRSLEHCEDRIRITECMVIEVPEWFTQDNINYYRDQDPTAVLQSIFWNVDNVQYIYERYGRTVPLWFSEKYSCYFEKGSEVL